MKVMSFSVAVVISSVILNLLLPLILAPGMDWAENTGSTTLQNFFGMMVHHNVTPFVSSVTVALIVFLSLIMGDFLLKVVSAM